MVGPIDFQDPGLEECYVSEPFLSYQSFRAIVIDFISRHYTSTSHICLPRLSDKAVYKVAQDFQGWFGKFKVDDEVIDVTKLEPIAPGASHYERDN